ncbi:hypothetical protein MVEG_11628 [Podila verticillata NRRL 6337]|uniref:Concentrative nucleoside transporter N-terminal domain-containing protein n=1 Tax=Podila verticillata NRRL 6337 TaxID=1069443 RepID=A0A086TKE2_9FUNG|nr:hypothetical protein MVEG_11628 [Podila verticillata NRRL 6337]
MSTEKMDYAEDHTQVDMHDNDDNMSQHSTDSYHGRFGFYYNNESTFNYLLTFLICTGLFIPAVIMRKEGNVLVLSLLYGAIMWWLLARVVPEGTLTRPVAVVWRGGAAVIEKLPKLLVRVLGYGVPPVAMILTAALRADDIHGTRGQRLISCLGLVVLLSLTIVFSKNFKAISWKIVWTGIFMQYILGLLIIRWSVGYEVFNFIAQQAENFLSYAEQGREFIFGPNSVTMPDNTVVPFASSFAISVLPALILFAAVIQYLYYHNIVQSVVASMASIVIHVIDISGVECVAACAAPFVGMSSCVVLSSPR